MLKLSGFELFEKVYYDNLTVLNKKFKTSTNIGDINIEVVYDEKIDTFIAIDNNNNNGDIWNSKIHPWILLSAEWKELKEFVSFEKAIEWMKKKPLDNIAIFDNFEFTVNQKGELFSLSSFTNFFNVELLEPKWIIKK